MTIDKELYRKAYEHGYRYVIIGGIALAQWEVARYTHDVDIKVLVPGTDYAAVRRDIRTAFPDRARVIAPENPFIVAVKIQGVIVDFLLTLPGYERLIVERSVQRDLGEFQAWICSAEDLIIQKVVAGRGKDGWILRLCSSSSMASWTWHTSKTGSRSSPKRWKSRSFSASTSD